MKAGYTLPVFACAGAIAALKTLRDRSPISTIELDLIQPAQTVSIEIEQVAQIQSNVALGITRSDPGDNLDLTRNTPIWSIVERTIDPQVAEPTIAIEGGEGIGRKADGTAAIYGYAHQLFTANLMRSLEPHEHLRVTIVLPEGRSLAKRTSNEAFGVVEGLSLLGTSGIAQPLSAPDQLEAFREELQQKAKRFDCLVFCVGENGLDLATQLGIDRDRLVKTANWIGSLLVEAGLQQVKSVLLFGYHGKLIKLAGGIFHTHHHVADGRLEILTAQCAKVGLPLDSLQHIFEYGTAEDGLAYLRSLPNRSDAQPWVEQVYSAIANTIDRRTQTYIHAHSAASVQVGTVLFDRSRHIFQCSEFGSTLLNQIC